MDILKALEYKNFVVVGDTLNPDKYAYKIKEALLIEKYNVEAVYKELAKIDDVSFDEFVLDMVINPIKGYELISEMAKKPKVVIFQPNTISHDLEKLLKSRQIPYIESCVLVGLRRKDENNRR